MEQIKRRTLAALAAPAVPMSALTLPLVTFIPEHYANALGMNLAVVGLTFMAVRLLDIGFDPVIGALMDRTRTRWGRFRPWLAGGIPLVMVGTGMLFFAPQSVGPLYLLVALLITYAGYSVVTLAQLALLACVSTSYDVRSRIFSWWQAATTGGIIVVMLLPTLLGGTVALGIVALMGASILITTPIGIGIALWGVNDTSLPPPSPRATLGNYLALFKLTSTRRLMSAELLLGLVTGIAATTGLIYIVAVKQLTPQQYGTMVLVYFLIAIASSPLWTMVAKRMEKHRALMLAAASYIVYLALIWFVPPGRLDLVLLVSVFGGVSFTASSLLPRAMLADIADEERLVHGADRTGLLYALLTGIYKVGQAMSVGIAFVLLDLFGFDAKAGAANPPDAILGVALVYVVLTSLCAAAALLTMIGYPLTAARHREIQAASADDERVAAGDEAGVVAVKV